MGGVYCVALFYKLKMNTTTHKAYNSLEDMPESYQSLVRKAHAAMDSSYSPYSNFTVGAALQLADDTIITGSNQENASYPAGLCAERVALFAAGAIHPGKEVKVLAVVAKRRDSTEYRGAGPCGMCRQVMLEYEHKQDTPMHVIFKLNDKWVVTESAEVLLPFSFGKENL